MKIFLIAAMIAGISEAKTVQLKINGKCLDVPAAKFDNEAKIQLWDCNGTNAQQFEIVDSVAVTPPPVVAPPPVVTPDNGKSLAVYLQSWSCNWVSKSADHCVANVSPFVDTIYISFAKPDSSYVSGSKSFASAGIDFWADWDVVAGAIKIAQNKSQKVILSVGGATFHGWPNLNAQSLKAVVNDLGLHGIDIDWEGDQVCGFTTGGNSCPKDQELISVIRALRTALPRPKV